ncbi:MAG: cytosine permease [Streptosporangiales bacterium]|nr:cytosine permease [Streptosporangiales bacterium]
MLSNVDPDYPIDPVPKPARRSAFSVLVVLLGFTFFTPTMLAGAQVGAAFSFGEFLGVLLLGSAVLGLYVAVLGAIGARTGLTTVLMSRYALGSVGAKGASLLLGGTQVGWYGVAAAALADLTAQAFGWGSGAEQLLMVAAGALMGVTAYYGYRGMYWLSAVSIPPMFVLAFWVVARSLGEVDGWAGLTGREGTGTLGLAAAVTIIVGTFASGGTQAPNWTRFARSGTQAFWAALAAFLVGNGLMLFFGATGAIAFGQADFVLVLYELGLVAWGLVLLVGNLWTTNDNAAYAFGVAGAEIFNRPDKRPFVVGGVVLGTLLAVSGVYDWLTTYLLWLGIVIPPLGGVIIGDWLRSWRRGLPEPATHGFPAVRWGNLAAYAVGALTAWGTGELGWGVPPVNGVLAAMLAVWIFGLFTTERAPTRTEARETPR